MSETNSRDTIILGSFHTPLLFRKNFEYSWNEHGNLAGHISCEERVELNRKRVEQEMMDINYALAHQEEFPVLQYYVRVVDDLYKCFGTAGLTVKGNFDFFLFSGFSRSGGTYQQNEYAKMRGVNIREQHIEMCHDYFPKKAYRAAFDYKQMLSDLHIYFGLILTLHQYNRQNSFFFRTIQGALYVPYIRQLAQIIPGMNFYWRHMIRDVHGALRSLIRYFGENNLQWVEGKMNYNSVTSFDTLFGNVTMNWFMANTSILPTMRGLPFWDVKIDPAKPLQGVIDDIEKSIEDYIHLYGNIRYYDFAKPIVHKFGKDVEKKCNEDAAFFQADSNYKADTFNYKPVIEFDDKYTEMYECLKIQLTSLYQAFDIDFDGKLERI